MSNRRYGPWSHARNPRNPLQFAGLVLWSLLISLRWLHAQFVQPAADWVLDTVLGAWEESVKAVIREAFGVVTHYTNYISGAILSVFSGSSYFQTVKRTTVGETKSWAWHSYWESATGTFNALLESEGLSGITLPSPLLRRASTPTPGTPRAHASAELVHQAAPAVRPQPAWHRRLADWWGRRRGSGETSAADAVGTQRAQQPGRPGSKAKAPGYQNGGARLGAAGQRKGLQQQAGISGQGRAEAAGRGASLARGSLLFELPSGFAISEGLQRLGLVEGARVAAEVGVTRAFSAVRRGLRRLFLLEGASSRRPADYVARLDPRQRQARGPGDSKEALARMPSGGSRSGRKPSWWRRLGRLAGASDGQQPVEDLNVWTASDIILRAGYPLEEHSVTTPDGYILQMHRIPRPGTRDVVFFQHGVLDTSLGWVANGSVGSQAFAAYDAGFDVWLANARSNAPRLHKDPHKRGSRYWHYSSNELGLMDIAAQIDHLHAVKCREILMQRRERAPWAAWRMPSSAVQAQAGGLREAANGGTEAAAGNRSSAAAAAAAAQQTRRSEGASGGTGDSPRRASQGNGSAADDCAAADGDGSRELPGAAEAATGGQPLGGLGSWGSGCAAAAGAGEGGGAARLGRSASAPLLQGGWQGWHASGMEVSPSQVDFGDAAGGQGLEGLDREGHVQRWGGGGLRATEQKIGAAAAAADAAGSSTGAGREPRSTAPLDSGGGGVFSALLGGASLQLGNPTSQHPSPPAAAAAQLGPGLAQWGSTDSHAGDGQPAPQPGMQHAAGAADGTAGLRRTQSAGAILSLRQVVGRSRGSKARRTRNCGAGPQAAPIMAALEPAEGRVVEGCGVEEHLLRPLKPIRTNGSPGTTPRSRGTNGASDRSTGRSYPSPSTPSSLPKGSRSTGGGSDVHSCSDGSSDETEADGYATPHSAGYDTPRSGYTTPGSEHSGSVRSGSVAGAEVDVTPYRLQVVGHSLGAASVLLYAVGRRMLGQPHRIRRIILMSPAGFHTHVPMALRPFKYLMPLFVRLLGAVRPGVGMGLRLPSPLLRFAVFKLTMDLDHIPALHELVRAGMRLMLSGDRSQWDRAMLMPHYNTFSMPALSLHCGAHFAQWSRDPSFRLFDYGSRAANRRQYGTDVPPSIADHYHLLGPVPVDLIAGRFDGIISCQDVQLHYERMKEAGVHVTYREYDFGHMDFTFAVKDEIRRYVLSRLQRPIL